MAACLITENESRQYLRENSPLKFEELVVRDKREKQTVLHVQDLKKHFVKEATFPWEKVTRIHAVDGLTFSLNKGETLGIVGESGCGKSTTARLLLSLDEPTAGNIIVEGVELSKLKGKELKRMRGRIQMVFQDAYSSFNPKLTIEEIIAEPLTVQQVGTAEERKERVRDLLFKVGLDPSYVKRYPGQLSGGQRQRVGIARALALGPSVIVADEPTSALDVSVRAQVINLMRDLQDDMDLSFIFISHDLSTVRYISDRIAVMYLGEMVESGPANEVFENPLHPYTQALLAAVPIPDPVKEGEREISLITGDLPSPANPPSGCRFHTRCPLATDKCNEEKPELSTYSLGREVSCHYVN